MVLDQLDFSVVKEKFALHQTFRNTENMCKQILACSVIGWNAILYKFEKDSLPIEQWYNLKNTSNLTSLAGNIDRCEHLLNLWSPKFPHFPDKKTILNWIKENDALPIFAGSPPLAEGILTQRVVLCLLNKEYPPYAKFLPPVPSMYIYDGATLEGEFIHSNGTLHNEKNIAIMWNKFDEIEEGN